MSSRVTTPVWTVQLIERLRAEGMSWTLIGERYGATATRMRERYYQRKRALQPTRLSGCDGATPYALAAAPSD